MGAPKHTSLRGLRAFDEAGRDAFLGRQREREDLAKLVTSDGFRAGVVYGEPGVGKTSLLAAGVVPDLRERGIIVVPCTEHSAPARSIAEGLAAQTKTPIDADEDAVAYVSRVVGAAGSQLFVFVIDDCDTLLAGDRDAVSELGDLYARAATRSAGRARFLFSCADSRLHRFSALEQRTGSLFPPSNRVRLERFSRVDAADILNQTLGRALGGDCAELSQELAGQIAVDARVLPADLQIAALVVAQHGGLSADELKRVGWNELERRWFDGVCAATGSGRSAQRLLAQLARLAVHASVPTTLVAARAGVAPADAASGLRVLADSGIVNAREHDGEILVRLAHEVLAPKVLAASATADAAARRAYELLGFRAGRGTRLSARDAWRVYREKIAATTPLEEVVLRRTRRFFGSIAVAIVALVFLGGLASHRSMADHFYLDVAQNRSGGEDVVVRAGRAGLAFLHWLPSSPAFGSVIADTGLTRAAFSDEAWEKVQGRAVDGARADYGDAVLALVQPELASLIAYASTGGEPALDAWRATAEEPEAFARLVDGIAPIARGTRAEVALIEAAVRDPAMSVRAAAFSLMRRWPRYYAETLEAALTASDEQLRRMAIAVVRALDSSVAEPIVSAASAAADDAIRRELEAVHAPGAAFGAPTAVSTVVALTDRKASPQAVQDARALLRRMARRDPMQTGIAVAEVLQDPAAPVEEVVFALELLADYAPTELHGELAAVAEKSRGSKDEKISAAALPLYAITNPREAAGQLALMLDVENSSSTMRAGLARAWGRLAGVAERGIVVGAFEKLLPDPRRSVRIAVAESYGRVGRFAQAELIKMVKREGSSIALAAARGLANSAAAGASSAMAVGGIYQLWKRKGRMRREAATIFAQLARHKPAAVFSYLRAAALSRDDVGLHALGVDGLCSASAAGHKGSRRTLVSLVDGKASTAVRRRLMDCATDFPAIPGVWRIAARLSAVSPLDIRRDAARALAVVAAQGSAPAEVAQAIVALVDDKVRTVRLIALDALGALGPEAPASARDALASAFDRADNAEKLANLAAARAIGDGSGAARALGDPATRVRIAGLDLALATKTAGVAALASALGDVDVSVRRAALERLRVGSHSLAAAAVGRLLAVAAEDSDPEVSELALATIAQQGDPQAFVARLRKALALPSEAERAHAVRAARGLAEQDPNALVEVLEPLLDDPAHDVRVALLSSLARAYAATQSPDSLALLLVNAEAHATKRAVVAAAFVALAATDSGKTAAVAALEGLAESAPPMAQLNARLALGLIEVGGGSEMLARLIP